MILVALLFEMEQILFRLDGKIIMEKIILMLPGADIL
jgi:hypothetical protein